MGKTILVALLAILVALSGCVQPQPEVCGNLACGTGENCKTCSQDCGQCPELLEFEDSPFGYHPATGINRLDVYEEARDIGIRWDRGGGAPYVFWVLVDPNKTGDESLFQWGGLNEKGRWSYDSMLLSQESGLHRLHNIEVAPVKNKEINLLYRKTGSWAPIDEEAYRNFVKATVKRYPFVKYWQIGNEPSANVTASGYGEFVCMTYESIKEANPEAKVLLGGVSGLGADSKAGYEEKFDQIFLPLLKNLSKQNKRCFDIFDYHWYGPADGYYKLSKDVYGIIQEKIETLGIPEPEEYWITEMGSYSGDPQPTEFPAQTEKQQAADMVKRYVYPLSFGVKKVFWAWSIKEGFNRDCGYFDYTGIIYDGCDCLNREYICAEDNTYDLGPGVKKLAYYTFKKMTEKLEGSDWDSMQTIQESGDVYIYRFTKKDSGKPVWVAWNDGDKTKTATITLSKNASGAKITEAVPKQETGQEVTDFSTSFNELQGNLLESSPMQLQFELGNVPVYIEEK